MAKLILEMQVSLDGFMAGPGGQTDWMVWNWGPVWNWDTALQAFHTALTLSATHLVISRQMAEEGFIQHWLQTAGRQDEQATFSRHISATPKTVISTTLSKNDDIPGGWDTAEVASDPVAAIQQLKQQTTGNILVYGGATLVAFLLAHQLIDEMYILVNPVAIGKGMSVYTGLHQPLHFRLKEATAFSSGITVLHYAVPA